MEVDTIICGDCLEELPAIPEDSIDAIVCDPPYELSQGKTTDIKKGAGGFMGRKWDGTGIAYNTDMWAGCLRVLKPGGHLLAFGGDRTHHRMFCAIEDAGFEIRHTIVWTFGSGFPKSLSVDKAIDKYFKADREVVGEYTRPDGSKVSRVGSCNPNFMSKDEIHPPLTITAPSSPAAKQWAGYGSALKPAAEFICLARKPLSESTIAGNVLKWGCGGLNIDASRISGAPRTTHKDGNHQGTAPQPMSWGKDNSFFSENAPGRFPANLIWSHSPNCKRIGTKKVKGGNDPRRADGSKSGHNFHGFQDKNTHDHRPCTHSGLSDADGLETVESWDCAPDCPSWQFAKAGERKSGSINLNNHTNPKSDYNQFNGKTRTVAFQGDSGSVSRFFKSCQFTEEDIPAFMYYAKASRSEREKGLIASGIDKNPIAGCYGEFDGDGRGRQTEHQPAKNNHPTVKPLELMKYLCRLICPPNGIILDPFAGSGTTCLAAKLEGFSYIGIEKEGEYCEIARRRVAALPRRLTDYEEFSCTE